MRPGLHHVQVASLAVAALVATGFAACGRTQSPSTQPVTVAPGAAGTEPIVAVEEPAGNPSTNRIQCGKEVCDASSHVCCGFSTDYGCAPRKSAVSGPNAEDRFLPSINSCKENVASEYSFDELYLCDDSTDCPEGQVCCSQWLWSGAGLLACLPASEAGDQVCDYHERCAGDTCRTRDTHCVKNECHRVDALVTCSGVACSGDRPVCCQRGFQTPPTCERDCEPASEEDRVFEFECSRSEHCPPGAWCQSGMFGSYCAKSIDFANAVMLCESDGDCMPDGCEWLGKKAPPTCKLGQREGFKSCSCD